MDVECVIEFDMDVWCIEFDMDVWCILSNLVNYEKS